MLGERIEELMAEIKEHGELGAFLSPDGIVVFVRGTNEARRTYSLLMVEMAKLNVLTLELNDMRNEAGGLVECPLLPEKTP